MSNAIPEMSFVTKDKFWTGISKSMMYIWQTALYEPIEPHIMRKICWWLYDTIVHLYDLFKSVTSFLFGSGR